MTIVWVMVFFFASTAASSAYLTLAESLPVEIRATAFSLLFGLSMLCGCQATSGSGSSALLTLLAKSVSGLEADQS